MHQIKLTSDITVKPINTMGGDYMVVAACYGADRFGVIMSGLRGFCMSVEMNGFDRATSKLPDKGKRVVRQAMRLARWAHARGLWPL